MVRSFRCLHHRPPQQAGFLLPLAFSGSLVLLLGSLSIQTAALHSRRIQVGELSQRRGEDALASAAQRIAAQFQGSHHCLLPLPSSAWEGQALPSDCPSDLDLSGLQSSSQWGQVVRLNRWLPTAEGGELWLQLADRPLQRRYAIRLAPVFSLQELAS